MACVSRSRLERGGLTQFFCINRAGGNFRSEKHDPEMGQAPTSQARPRDTGHLRPSNSAARTLSLVEHALSTFGGDPCPVRRGLGTAVKFYVRKTRFFLCRQRTEMTHHYRRHCSRVSVRRSEILFCFVFSDPIMVGLIWSKLIFATCACTWLPV